MPAADRLDSSAVGIAQLVAHAADKSILCMRGGDKALPKLLWDFLFWLRMGWKMLASKSWNFPYHF